VCVIVYMCICVYVCVCVCMYVCVCVCMYVSDENMNVPLKQEDPNMQFYHTYRDITCSASSSLESYSGIFGKSSNIKNSNSTISAS